MNRRFGTLSPPRDPQNLHGSPKHEESHSLEQATLIPGYSWDVTQRRDVRRPSVISPTSSLAPSPNFLPGAPQASPQAQRGTSLLDIPLDEPEDEPGSPLIITIDIATRVCDCLQNPSEDVCDVEFGRALFVVDLIVRQGGCKCVHPVILSAMAARLKDLRHELADFLEWDLEGADEFFSSIDFVSKACGRDAAPPFQNEMPLSQEQREALGKFHALESMEEADANIDRWRNRTFQHADFQDAYEDHYDRLGEAFTGWQRARLCHAKVEFERMRNIPLGTAADRMRYVAQENVSVSWPVDDQREELGPILKPNFQWKESKLCLRKRLEKFRRFQWDILAAKKKPPTKRGVLFGVGLQLPVEEEKSDDDDVVMGGVEDAESLNGGEADPFHPDFDDEVDEVDEQDPYGPDWDDEEDELEGW